MNRLLHISSNSFPPLEVEHTTKKIWRELSVGFDEYHILARSKDNKFHQYQEGNIYLHLVPNLFKAKTFFFTSIYMLKILKKYNINVILSQCPFLGGTLATLISKHKGIPIMVELHGMEYFRLMESKSIINRLASICIKYSLNNATKVRSLSSKMTKMLNDKGIENNIVEIPNRVNLDIFKNTIIKEKLSNPIRIISVGRFVWEKGYENAINVIFNLRKSYKIELTLIGGGPLLTQYNEIIDNREGIQLIEWVSQEEFVPLLQNSDIYIQPSVSEGMPRTILEAMAVGLPVIASDVGAISGIIENNTNGIIVTPNNDLELETAIIKLIENDDLRRRIAECGYNDVINKYEWKSVFQKYRKELLSMT